MWVKIPNKIIEKILNNKINMNGKLTWGVIYLSIIKLNESTNRSSFSYSDIKDTFEFKRDKTQLTNALKTIKNNFDAKDLFNSFEINEELATIEIEFSKAMITAIHSMDDSNSYWFSLNLEDIKKYLNGEFNFKLAKSFNFYVLMNCLSNANNEDYLISIDVATICSYFGAKETTPARYVEYRYFKDIKEDLNKNKLALFNFKKQKSGALTTGWNFKYKQMQKPKQKEKEEKAISLESLLKTPNKNTKKSKKQLEDFNNLNRLNSNEKKEFIKMGEIID